MIVHRLYRHHNGIMITEMTTNWQQQSWQQLLQGCFSNVESLLNYLELPLSAIPYDMDTQFPLRVPLSFAAKIEKGNPACPLLRQVLPVKAERKVHPQFVADPLQELSQSPIPGLLHKFKNRVLLTPTGSCPVHCRYCFRRHFPYSEHQLGRAQWVQYTDYLMAHPEIDEVILSGGDPLTMGDQKLRDWFTLLSGAPSVKRVRIHSRTPIMIPQRLDADWSSLLPANQQVILVVHCNHPRELDEYLAIRIRMLKSHGVTVLNQSVLLKGVNDSVAVQVALANALFDHGILPYYLHQLDKVAGTQHFEISDAGALQIYEGMRAALSGYLLPRLVREVPGAVAKVGLL